MLQVPSMVKNITIKIPEAEFAVRSTVIQVIRSDSGNSVLQCPHALDLLFRVASPPPDLGCSGPKRGEPPARLTLPRVPFSNHPLSFPIIPCQPPNGRQLPFLSFLQTTRPRVKVPIVDPAGTGTGTRVSLERDVP
ncbi:hypothetical protein B0T14DRAFT_279184 [Immersiella caudata]|uniref:Uncharacterized protein n=1 Tax=Immersiella caudata TaxID=314043 RepID=A0AA39WDK0_9PEZI|nr:hypothetical protein B0T14DRAFT_279184 [Immersiella caudata]